jgi:RNA polymerase sigma factor (sigma-70 family)
MASHKAAVLQSAMRLIAAASKVTDRELLSRYTGGDEAAFATLVARHTAMVLGMCRRTLPRVHDAEDACQATFLVLARKAGSGRWQPSIANWLYTTARTVAHNTRMASDRRVRREAAAARSECLAESDDRMTCRELLVALDDELSRLPDQYREPLVLCYLEGLTIEEAAGRLAIPTGTLKTRVARARKRLHDALAKAGYGLGAGLLVLVTSSAGACPPRLIESILAAASGGLPPTVGDLANGVIMTGTFKKMVLPLAAALGVIAVGIGLRPMEFIAAAGQPPLRTPQKLIDQARMVTEPPLPVVTAFVEAAGEAARAEPPGELPDGALLRLGTTRFRHEGGMVTDVAFAPDGRVLATADGPTVYLWDVTTGAEIGRLSEPPPENNPAVVARIDRVSAIAWSQDSAILAVGRDGGAVRLWEVAALKPGRTWQAHEVPEHDPTKRRPGSGVSGVLFAAGGKALVTTGSDKTVRVWDPAAAKEVRRLAGHRGNPENLALSPDGSLIACTDPIGLDQTGAVHIWELATGNQIGRLPGAEKLWPTCLVFSPDGKGLAAAFGVRARSNRDAEVKVWEVPGGKELASFTSKAPHISGLVFASGGKALRTAAADGAIRTWDPTSGRELGVVKGGWLHGSRVVFTPDGQAAATPQFGAVHLGDVRTGQESSLTAGSNWPVVPTVSPDGRFVVTADGLGPARLWDASSGRQVRSLGGIIERFPHFSADGKTVLTVDSLLQPGGAQGNSLRLVETATGKEVRRIEITGGRDCVAVSADGKTAATCGATDALIRVWDVASGRKVRTIEAPKFCWALALSPDGKTLAAAAEDNTGDRSNGHLHLWEIATGKSLHGLDPGIDRQVFAITFSPDGKTLAAAGLETDKDPETGRGIWQPVVKLWDVGAGNERKIVQPGSYVTGLAFSPDGRLLATFNSGDKQRERPKDINVVKILDANTGDEVHRFSGHRGGVVAAAFWPDGTRLVTGSKDTTAVIWELPASLRRGGAKNKEK